MATSASPITEGSKQSVLLVDRNNPNRVETGIDPFDLKEKGTLRIDGFYRKLQQTLELMRKIRTRRERGN